MTRVVVTGMGGVCGLGSEWKAVREALRTGRSAVVQAPELAEIDGMRTRLLAPVRDFERPERWPRKKTRSMGRVSLLAARASELALESAGLTGSALLGDGSTGISYGSTAGSPTAMEIYARSLFSKRTTRGIAATDYVQFMSHTVAANLAQFFEIRGRVVPSCSACTSGSQGIGFGFEAIRFGRQVVMLTGGAEELHPIDAVVFDVLYATSTRNDEPTRTPRPFDADRDGLVVGEGAATLVLEELDHARARGARIRAELVGFGTNCDGRHLTNPDASGMEGVMRLALADAGLEPEEIDCVNAHGTATDVGDVAESTATHAVFGDRVPVSTLKGHLGHTLGACGAIEAWLAIEMMEEGWIAPTLNLETIDPRCAALDYVRGAPRAARIRHVMSNNFAFGGVNTSLIFRRWEANT
jgi:3-oxoacyl-[acyl-carrier-protein] synthase II